MVMHHFVGIRLSMGRVMRREKTDNQHQLPRHASFAIELKDEFVSYILNKSFMNANVYCEEYHHFFWTGALLGF